jgi:AcrR family transcriptional regulator
MTNVKPRYRQTRRAQAQATRRRIVDRAYQLFSEYGYAATTMDMIASAAGVAVQTVHYVFRTKATLFQEVIEVAAAGRHDPSPVMNRPWIAEALSAPAGRRAMAVAVEHGVDIYVRVAPLNNAIHAAASIDPDIEEYSKSIKGARRGGMSALIESLAAKDQLRPDLTVERAADLLFVLHSHETYLGLTRDSNWSLVEYKAWLYATLCDQLLSRAALSDAGAGSATRELSFHHLLSG